MLAATPVTSPPPNPADAFSPSLVAAHLFVGMASMLLAAVMLLCWPDAVVDSPLDPRTLAMVHVVTLGFVTTTAVGALHAVGPLALRLCWRCTWLDWALFAALLLVTAGVAAHMALSTFGGVAWSGALLALALVLQLPRWLFGLATAQAPLVIRVGIGTALCNLLFATGLGAAVAADRSLPLLPAGHQQALFAHAHLAAGGFAATLVTAVGLRLLPMFLPAAPPRGVLPWLAVLGTGLGGLLCGALGPLLPGALPLLSLPLLLGLATFLLLVWRMLRQGKPPPRDLPRPDAGRCLQLAAMVFVLSTLALGVILDVAAPLPPPWRTLYGLAWLLGALGSLILGVQLRLLPLVAWHESRRRLPALQLPVPPNRTWSPVLAWAMALGWLLGLAAVAVGIAVHEAAAVRAGGALLTFAMASALLNAVRCWRRRAASV